MSTASAGASLPGARPERVIGRIRERLRPMLTAYRPQFIRYAKAASAAIPVRPSASPKLLVPYIRDPSVKLVVMELVGVKLIHWIVNFASLKSS